MSRETGAGGAAAGAGAAAAGAGRAEAEDPELELEDLVDSIAGIRLGARGVPAAAVRQAGFVPAAGENRREQKKGNNWQQKQQLSRQAEASAKAWSEFQASDAKGGGLFGSKVSFKVGAKKSHGQKKQTHTAAVVHGAATSKPANRSWLDFKQHAPGGWDAAGVGPCLQVLQTDVASLDPGTQLRVPSAALVNGAGFVTIGRKTPIKSTTSATICIVLKDREVSSRHAQLGVSADGSLWLTDAGSKAGTLLNGRRLSGSREWSQPVALATGDVVQIGSTKLTAIVRADYSQKDAAASGLASTKTEPSGYAELVPEAERESQPGTDRERQLELEPELAVLDTCVLLDERELAALRRLVGRSSSGDSRHPPAASLHVVLPMVVLQELDGLKKNDDEELARRARRAVSFIHDAFAARAPWMIGQRPDQQEEFIAWQRGAVNDDHILACAVYFSHRQHRGRGPVVLMTLDKIFAVKAMTHGLAVVSPTEYSRRWPCEQVAAGMWGSVAAAPHPLNDTKRESRWGPTVLDKAQLAVAETHGDQRTSRWGPTAFDKAQSAVEQTFAGERAENDRGIESTRDVSAEAALVAQQDQQ